MRGIPERPDRRPVERERDVVGSPIDGIDVEVGTQIGRCRLVAQEVTGRPVDGGVEHRGERPAPSAAADLHRVDLGLRPAAGEVAPEGRPEALARRDLDPGFECSVLLGPRRLRVDEIAVPAVRPLVDGHGQHAVRDRREARIEAGQIATAGEVALPHRVQLGPVELVVEGERRGGGGSRA